MTDSKILSGNAIVGQSGGPTAAINATLSGVIRGALAHPCIQRIYGAFHGIDGILQDNLCDLTDLFADESKLRQLERTPSAALGSCRKKLPPIDGSAESEAVYQKVFSLFAAYQIHFVFYIGGNDSMDTVAKLSRYAELHDYPIAVMGVPKTIDNDVMGTDHTPGFGSAAKYIATSLSEIIRDCAVYAIPAVTIVEIMGRDAGWLTAASSLCRVMGNEPDLVYLPERIFSFENFFADLRECLTHHPNVVVAVSEGLRLSDGTYVGESAQSGVADVFGHRYLSGTGKALEIAVKCELGCKVRSVELNILQRCASHIASLTDIRESVDVGRAAVDAAADGVSGKMMTICRVSDTPYEVTTGYEDIEKIANRVRQVPDFFINEKGNGITDEGVRYLLPLISGECYPDYENGLPVQLIIPR